MKNKRILGIDLGTTYTLAAEIAQHSCVVHTAFPSVFYDENNYFYERDMYRYPSKFLKKLDKINFLGKKYNS